MRVIVVPPVPGWGSIGDKAILRVVVQFLQRKGHTVGLFRASERRVGELRDMHNPDGSCPRVRRLPWATKVFVLGADILDGRYGEDSVVKLKTLLQGSAVSVIGTTASNTLFFDGWSPRFVSCRDKKTWDALEGIQRVRCADPAFLTPPWEPADKKHRAWCKKHRFVTLNIAEEETGADIDLYLERIAALGGIAVHPIVHDFRQGRGDQEGRRKMILACQERGIPVWSGKPSLSPERIKWVASRALFSVVSKMHFGILSLSAGTPVIAHPYSDKFDELHRLFGKSAEILPLRTPCAEPELLQRFAAGHASPSLAQRKDVERLALAAFPPEFRSEAAVTFASTKERT